MAISAHLKLGQREAVAFIRSAPAAVTPRLKELSRWPGTSGVHGDDADMASFIGHVSLFALLVLLRCTHLVVLFNAPHRKLPVNEERRETAPVGANKSSYDLHL